VTSMQSPWQANRIPVQSSAPFWKYWGASATSRVGDGITAVAFPLLALTQLQASNFEVGLLTAAEYAAIVLVGLPAGVIARRFALRRMQVTMDGLRALAILTVPVAAWMDVLTLPHLVAVAFVVGLASNLFDVANSTFLPLVVPKDQLIARNGLMSGTVSTTQLAGPALGGVLVQAVGAAYSVLVDAATFLVSAVLLSRTPETRRPAATLVKSGFFQQVAEGFGFVLRHRVMRPAVLAATAVNFASGAIAAVTPTFLVRTLGLPPGVIGLVMAAEGAGTIVAAALTAPLVRRAGSGRALLMATTAAPFLGLAMPLAVTGMAPAIFVFGIAGCAACIAVLSVVARTHRQLVSPPDLLSRVTASVRFVSWGVIPVGALLAGGAAQLWSPRAGLVLACAALFLAPVALWVSVVPRLKDLLDAESTTAPSRPEATRSHRTSG
jgi:MFS family permease